MIEFQTRDPVPADDWASGPLRSAGLYGELRALPLRLPVDNASLPALAPRGRRRTRHDG